MKHLKRLLTRHIAATQTQYGYDTRPFGYVGRHRGIEVSRPNDPTICTAPAVLSETETREAVSA